MITLVFVEEKNIFVTYLSPEQTIQVKRNQP